ncbi:MAG: hypothetical protein AB7I09_19200 [Planctomycetota bacterium]
MQAFPSYGLPTSSRKIPWGLATAFLAWLLVASATATAQPFGPTERESLLEQLGASDWLTRESATQRVLGMGREAVPWLRQLAQELQTEGRDRETLRRVEWLLGELAPRHRQVRIVELGDRHDSSGGGRGVLQWLQLDVPRGRPTEGTTAGPGGTPQRILVELLGSREDESHNVWLEYPDDGDTLGPVHRLQAGEIRVCFSQDHVAQDHLAGRVDRQLTSSLWLVWLSPPEPGVEEPALSVEQIEEQLRDACQRLVVDPVQENRDAAFAIAEFWGRPGLTPATGILEEDRELEWIVRARGGDASAVSQLEAWFAEHESEPAARGELRERVALVLADVGHEPAVRALVRGLVDMGPWPQHRAVVTLQRYLTDPARVTSGANGGQDTIQTMVDVLLDAETYGNLPWHSSELVVLLQELRQAAPEAFYARLLALLEVENQSALDRNWGATRVLLQSLLALREGRASAAPRWLDTFLLPLIENVGYCEEALCVARDTYLRGEIDAAAWDRVLGRVERDYRSADQGIQHRIENVMRQLVHVPAFTAEQRRAMWRVRLACYDGPGYLPTRVDRDFVDRFGPLDERAPEAVDPNNPSPAWVQRKQLWEARLSAANLDEVRPGATEEVTSYRLVECLFRVDDATNSTRLLRFETGVFEEGIAYPATGASGEDRTRWIRAQGTQGRGNKQVELGNGRNATLGRPLLGGSPGRDMYMELSQRDDRYGAQPDRRRQVQYQVLTLIDDVDALPPLASWSEVAEHLASRLASASEQELLVYVDLAGKLRISEWLPAIAARFDSTPTPALARALLRFGDDRGREVLRKSMETHGVREAIESVRDLVVARDPWAIDRALSWLENPPADVKANLYQVLEGIDRLLLAPDPPAIDRDRLVGALIASLEQRYLVGRVIPVLRRITGREFGYLEAFSIADRNEQQAAQAEAIARWKAWWQNELDGRRAPEDGAPPRTPQGSVGEPPKKQ